MLLFENQYLFKKKKQMVKKAFTLTSDADNPDTDGSFNMNWDASIGAENYSIYVHNSYITDINGRISLIASGITGLTHPISGLGNGTYYYVVIAYNHFGQKFSNCIEVNVQIISGNSDDVDKIDGLKIPYGNYYLFFIVVGIFFLILKQRRHGLVKYKTPPTLN